jgi:hypothetical protein
MEDIKLVENDITNAQEQKENGDCEAVIMLLAKPIEVLVCKYIDLKGYSKNVQAH